MATVQPQQAGALNRTSEPMDRRSKALQDYRKKLLDHRDLEAKLKDSNITHSCKVLIELVRLSLRDLDKNFAKTEDDIKALQSVGQVIGEVLKQLDDERCKIFGLSCKINF